jgi:phage tail-like protein
MTARLTPPLVDVTAVATEVATALFALVAADPGADAAGVAAATVPTVRVAHLTANPAAVPAGTYSVMVEVDLGAGAGWEVAYTSGTGFAAPWTGAGSAVTFHVPASPYVWTEVAFDHTSGALPANAAIAVRVTASDASGFGFGMFGTAPFGGPGTTTEVVATYAFATVDTAAPQVVSAVATARDVVRVTFSEAMRLAEPDGRASVTTTTDETAWGALPAPGTLTARVDAGATQEAAITADMLSTVYAPTAEDLAHILPALIAGITAAANADGTLKLETVASGDAASLQITGGTWQATLLFPTALATGGDSSALSASNYTLDRHNVYPAVAVHLEATAAADGDGTGVVVDLTVQWPMTPGAPYSVTVASDVADATGNAIDPAVDSATFTGWTPATPTGRVVKFPIPQAAYEVDDTQELRAFVNALEEVWALLLSDIDRLPDLWDPDRATGAALDLHLADAGNPFAWAEADLTEVQRRRLLRALPTLYQYRGTDAGIEAAILTVLEVECHVARALLDTWTLGVSLLGDYYPAQVVGALTAPYNFAAADADLWVAVDGGHALEAADPTAGTITLAGRNAALYVAGYGFRVWGSTALDGAYTTVSSVETGDSTVVTVAEAVTSTTADGAAIQVAWLSSAAGVDFVVPAAATADEVVTALVAQLTGAAAAVLNPGTGDVVAVASTSPSGTIQVAGGTAAVILGFDTARHAATGGCVLGPGTARLRRTFDLVVDGALPDAATQAAMARIANWAKPVNTHLGRIRTEFVISDDGIWRLGRSRLGEDTVLG